jgi:lauroyl/myristoyl acyltransferase
MNIKIPAFVAPKKMSFPRDTGDIQAAVVTLVQRLAPDVPVARQAVVAQKIAEVITSQPSTMSSNMFLRQSIIRGRTATTADVIDGLAAWVTILFDLDNLQRDRRRALNLEAVLPNDDVKRLERALSKSRNGCILALPHIGSIQLFVAHLRDRGFKVAFVYTMSDNPTPVEQWIRRGYHATHGVPIQFGRRNTGSEISNALRENSVVCLVVDVYPSSRFSGVRINLYNDEFNFPPGPAKYAQSGTLVMPGFASRRDAVGFSMRILDPIEHHTSLGCAANTDFTQRLGDHITGFSAAQPQSYWLWHPIPNDPFRRIAERRHSELLRLLDDLPPHDEAVASAIEALDAVGTDLGIDQHPRRVVTTPVATQLIDKK